MGSPQVSNSDLVVTTEREVELEAFGSPEHAHHTAVAEATTLLENERQIERTNASLVNEQSDTDPSDRSVPLSSTSPDQNHHQQNCDSLGEAAQPATADDLNSMCQSNTSNSSDVVPSSTVKERTAHKRLRLTQSWCLWVFGCGCILLRKPLKIQVWKQILVLLAAIVAGAIVPVAVCWPMLANARNEAELSSKQLRHLLVEMDETRVELMGVRVHQRADTSICNGSSSNSSTKAVAPDYTFIDSVIEDPPSDAAARSLYYQLAPFKKEHCCARDPKFWRRLAVAQHMLGFVQGENNSAVFLDYMIKANDSAYYAIRLGANDSDTYSWTAIIDGLLGEKSTHFRVKLATSYRFKYWIDKAMELYPDNLRALTVLGRYHVELSRVSNVERALASMMFGPIPDGSIDKALDNLQRAERTLRSRGRVCRETWLFLAMSLQQKAQPDRARVIAQEAAAQPVRTVFDRIYQPRLEELLEQLR